MRQTVKQEVLKTQKCELDMIGPPGSYITNPQYNKSPVCPILFSGPLILSLAASDFQKSNGNGCYGNVSESLMCPTDVKFLVDCNTNLLGSLEKYFVPQFATQGIHFQMLGMRSTPGK